MQVNGSLRVEGVGSGTFIGTIIPDTPWDPVAYFGARLLAWWDAVDSTTISISNGFVTAWTSKVGGLTATPVNTNKAVYSPNARNGLPALVLTGVESLAFPSAGLPINDSTIIAVGYMNPDANWKAFGGYGGGFSANDSRIVGSWPTTNKVGASIVGYDPIGPYSWDSIDRIVISEFINSTGLIRQSVDGNIDPAFPHKNNFNTLLNKGRIGCNPAGNSLWKGAQQCFMIIDGTLTQLEKDKLSGWLARRYNLVGNLPATHPYKNFPPSNESTLSSDLLAGYTVVWSDHFASLSLRTGGMYPGYVSGKGTWADVGMSYMTQPQGFTDFGWGYFIRHDYNWQAIDPTFPPLGMLDITANGLEINGSEAYSAVRASLPLRSGNVPFLSGLVSSAYSMKIGYPYARRVNFTITGTANEFPAVWGVGELYAGVSTRHHNEIDDFEWFGGTNNRITSQGTHITGTAGLIGGGGSFDTGASIVGVNIETLMVRRDGYVYLYTNGVLTFKVLEPIGHDTTDLDHIVLNMAVGFGWLSFPNGSIGSPKITIRSVEILAPSSNTSGVFPIAPPVPILAWGVGFANGSIPASAPDGTVIGTLTGAATYSILGTTKLTVNGSNLQTVGTQSNGAFPFYVQGMDSVGIPGIAPKLTAIVN